MHLRLATPADAPGINAIYRPFVTDSAVSFELVPPSDAVMRERIVRVLAKLPWLVCEQDGALLGYAYAMPHRERPAYQWSVEISVYVHESARRRGIGRTLYQALFWTLERQGYYTVYGGIALPNPASVRLHEAMGFEPVGVYRKAGYKLGAWRDVGWWQRSLREYGEPAPVAPRPLAVSNGALPGLLPGQRF
jgi:L-amino acid N-acyltransferase YncA